MESIIFVLLLLLLLPLSLSQPPPPAASPPPVPSPPPPSDDCNGVYLSYAHTSTRRLPPLADDPSRQPYRFESTVTILNHDIVELKAWKLFVGFRHDEYLVSATNAVLADGKSVPGEVGNGTVFAGFPNGDLKTAVETAGDEEQMRVRIELVGTQFGVAEPDVPMPANISLAMDGFDCSNLTRQGSMMYVCCLRDERFKANITEEEFLPRQYGDLTIDYDVLRSYESEYYARVKIANHHALGRLDYWQLSWDWMREEFIYSMKGAHPTVGDSNGCVYGSQGEYYKELDFSSVLSCEKRPTIVDLPVSRTNDSNVGMVPFCCRNGTILPNSMDPSKSISAFELQVRKMPPDINKTALIPPQNWQINGTLNADYVCGPPVRVSPNQFPDPSGLPFNRTAVASWQVVCNITQPKNSSPKCCVSFSAFYNDSVIPCRTCACGCPRNSRQTCSATSPSLFLPPEALLVPFDNRTAKALAWANLKHRPTPDPLPCPDNCGVSINWHVFTDYSRGWTARVTLFNWGDTNFADWFAAMEFEKAVPGFERMYSFNGSALDSPNNTIFMQGLPGLNYLVAEQNGTNPDRDPRVPGKQQSVISFTKRRTPGIDVPAGDGFPTKVFFNGEECLLPTIIPSSSAHKTTGAFMIFSLLLTVIVTALMQQ